MKAEIPTMEIVHPKATFNKLCEHVGRFVEPGEWQKYHTTSNLAASVSIEAGELLELFQWSQ